MNTGIQFMKEIINESSTDYILKVLKTSSAKSKVVGPSRDKNCFNKMLVRKKRFMAAIQGLMVASAAIDLLWAIISLIEVGIAGTIVLVSLFSGAALILGLMFTYHHYNKIVKEEEKRFIEYTTLKQKTATKKDLLLQQEEVLMEEIKQFVRNVKMLSELLKVEKEITDILNFWWIKDPEKIPAQTIKLFMQDSALRENMQNDLMQKFKACGVQFNNEAYKKLHRLEELSCETKTKESQSEKDKGILSIFIKSKKSLIVVEGLGLASILFATFYWCATSIATALQVVAVAAALSSPAGIAIALAVSVGLSLLYAKHMYDKHTLAHQQKELIKNAKAEYEEQKCNSTRMKQEIKQMQKLNEKMHQTLNIHQIFHKNKDYTKDEEIVLQQKNDIFTSAISTQR